MEENFVKKLNSMPSANGVAGKHRVDDWNKTIEGLHYNINGFITRFIQWIKGRLRK